MRRCSWIGSACLGRSTNSSGRRAYSRSIHTTKGEKSMATAATEVKKDISSLRATLEWLDSEGDLLKTDVEVDPDLEITGLQKHLDGGPVLLFNNVKGKPHARAITNLLSDINVVDKIFGYKDATERTKRLAHAMTRPLKPIEVSQ